MAIEAALVKELRERTGAGMMDCKRALVDADGDLDHAAELLRKAGQAAADKKSARVAAEGKVVVKGSADERRHVIVEVNSETDFVAKDQSFSNFAEVVADTALTGDYSDLAGLMEADVGGQTLEMTRQELVAKIGENIAVRRFETLKTERTVGAYTHMGRTGVLVEIEGGDQALAHDLALQIAAMSPLYVSPDDVPGDELAKEREILAAQALREGKPENIVEKMVEGRLRKHLEEITLTGQVFVKDTDRRVSDLLAGADARVVSFIRFTVGEGIEKKENDFVQEVMAQASQSR